MRVIICLVVCLTLLMYVAPVGGRRVRKRCKPLVFKDTTSLCDKEPNGAGWYRHRTVCMLDCREGCVKNTGGRRRVCKVRGRSKWWTGGRGLQCFCNPCDGTPSHPEGYTADCGPAQPSYPAGHYCNFTCPYGYVKTSADGRKLCDNGRWRGSDQACEASCLVRPLYGPSADENYTESFCVNYDVLLPEIKTLTRTFNRSLAEIGLSNVLTDLEDLSDVGLVNFDGEVGPITADRTSTDSMPTVLPTGGARRRKREATSQSNHWSRIGHVTSLVYDALAGPEERLVSFAASYLEDLSENDTLQGPVQGLREDVVGFNRTNPDTIAEATPFLVEDFDNMLDSFDCSNNGTNCDLTRGLDDVVQLDDQWYIVYRPALEYNPTSTKRGIRFRILIVAWRGFRIFILCFIY